MANIESSNARAAGQSEMVARFRICGMAAAFLMLSACAEIVGELIDEANIGHCWSCEWIMQEWHEGWETHNSDPYDDENACEQQLAISSQQNRELGYRCINEETLIDMRRDASRNQSEVEPVKVEHCWGCDWVVEELRYDTWVLRGTETYKTQGKCEQALWQRKKTDRDKEYRCIY
jgi:hypothetical protein